MKAFNYLPSSPAFLRLVVADWLDEQGDTVKAAVLRYGLNCFATVSNKIASYSGLGNGGGEGIAHGMSAGRGWGDGRGSCKGSVIDQRGGTACGEGDTEGGGDGAGYGSGRLLREKDFNEANMSAILDRLLPSRASRLA